MQCAHRRSIQEGARFAVSFLNRAESDVEGHHR
jgi:hypothetical protein